MRKLILLVIIFVMFSVSASALSPPPSAYFRYQEELSELRKVAEADEIEFSSVHLPAGALFKNHNDVIKFFELLDSLPFLYMPEMQFRNITYVPSYNMDFDISFESEVGERFRFMLSTKEKRTFEEIFGDELSLLYENQEYNTKIYARPENLPDDRGVYYFCIDIDGYTVYFTRFPRDSGRSLEDFLEDIHENMIITSFRDEPWNNNFTTDDALTVLRAVAGLSELTAGQAARFGISGTPTTEDVLRILRIIAGLS